MKTVYVIGAGFSKGAGAPMQYEIVRDIFQIAVTNPYQFREGTVEQFRSFLLNTIVADIENTESIQLEDIFTPIDRCITDNIAFRDYDVNTLKKIRETIYYLIGKTIEIRLRGGGAQYVDIFAWHLVSQSSHRKDKNYSKTDPVTVLSTNWDILLDNALKRVIREKYSNDAVVDYCCYISSYDEDDNTIKPGLLKLGEGGFNVKLLKLHGSLNWLHCPRCMRIYVSFDQKIAANMVDTVKCRHCQNNFGTDHSHYLTSNLIMPTFIKDLSNPQYKIIWQNAGIELSEADNIVFLGYSLPLADFEMRQLLSRMVRSNAKIKVVDFGEESNFNVIELKKRYHSFFGKREIKFYLRGAENYIREHFTG